MVFRAYRVVALTPRHTLRSPQDTHVCSAILLAFERLLVGWVDTINEPSVVVVCAIETEADAASDEGNDGSAEGQGFFKLELRQRAFDDIPRAQACIGIVRVIDLHVFDVDGVETAIHSLRELKRFPEATQHGRNFGHITSDLRPITSGPAEMRCSSGVPMIGAM